MGSGERPINGSPLARKSLGKRINLLERELASTNKEVRVLKDTLNIKDNWPSVVTAWVGKEVLSTAHSGRSYTGRLIWIDRYNIAIMPIDVVNGEDLLSEPRIIPKGSIESIQLKEG